MDINTLNMKEAPLLLRNGQFDSVILDNKLVFLPFLLFLFGDSTWSMMEGLKGGEDLDICAVLSNVCVFIYKHVFSYMTPCLYVFMLVTKTLKSGPRQ